MVFRLSMIVQLSMAFRLSMIGRLSMTVQLSMIFRLSMIRIFSMKTMNYRILRTRTPLYVTDHAQSTIREAFYEVRAFP
jgi:hypothetical protein